MKAKLEVDLVEVWAIIEDHRKMLAGIPKDRYDQPTAAGHTLGYTARRIEERISELNHFVDLHWPK